MKKAKVLFCIDWYYPSFKAGGPIKSVSTIIQALKNEIDFYILCSNKDIDGTTVEEEPNQWVEKQGVSIYYLSYDKSSLSNIKKTIEELDPQTIHLNSLFSKTFTLFPFLVNLKSKRKIILAPRGMLTVGALSIKSNKKKVFIKIFKYLVNLKGEFIWHATSNIEKGEIEQNFGKKRQINVAENLSSPPRNDRNMTRVSYDELKLVCLGRFSQIKNQAWLMNLVASRPKLRCKVDYYGPKEDKVYWEKCKSIIKQDNRQEYKGLASPQLLNQILTEYHFLVCPSVNENYGHSIVEALTSQVPVIVSDGTPWKGLEKFNAGYTKSLEKEAEWQDLIDKLISNLDEQSYTDKVKGSYSYSKSKIFNQAVLERNRNLFK